MIQSVFKDKGPEMIPKGKFLLHEREKKTLLRRWKSESNTINIDNSDFKGLLMNIHMFFTLKNL